MTGKLFKKHKTEVLVAGAGPVGLFTALALDEQGVAVEIVDGQWRPTSRSYALALHPSSLELFDELGLVGKILGCSHRIDRLAFYDAAERRDEVRFSELDLPYPFVAVLPQQALEDLLVEELAKRNVPVKWSHRLAKLDLNGKKVAARVEKLGQESTGYSVSASSWVVEDVLDSEARYVVGADGHNSRVRQALEIDFAEIEDAVFFGVFEFGADKAVMDEVCVALSETATDVLWPLADGRFRWSFQLDDNWEFVPDTRTKSRLAVQIGGDTFPYLDETRLQELIRQRAPWFTATLGDIRWSVGVRFEKRLADRFGRGAAWLVGDAAHLASPVGVQSMNVGLKESRDLAQLLGRVVRHGDGPEILEAYNTERLAEWRRLLGLEGAPAVKASADDWIKRQCRRIPATLPASGEPLRLLLRQLGIEMNPT